MEQSHAPDASMAIAPERSVVMRGRENDARSRLRRGSAHEVEARTWNTLLGPPALTAAEFEVLDALAMTRAVTAGQTVFTRSTPASHLVALQDGEVALGYRTADGTFRTERIVRGIAWLDPSSAWLDAAPSMDARAQSLSTVIEISCAQLAAQFSRYPALARRLLNGLAHEVQALADNTHELMHKDAPARLGQWLRQRCEPVAGRDGVGVVQLRERKRDVASQLAITPETLSRLMRSFSRQGVIEVAGYTVRVLDTAALSRIAEQV